MHNFTTITITTFCLALLFGQTQGNDVLAMGRNVEKPKILSIEECKKIAEKDFQTHLDILLKAPEVHPGDKERNLAEYNLLSGAKITDWTVYLGYDDLPYAVEFLFKKNGRGVWSSTIIMRGEGGPIYGSAICPEVLKQYPHAEVQLAVARLPKWIETLKTKGYPVTENTPYDLYFLKAHSCYFVVFKIEENGKKDEIVVDLYDGPIQDLGYFRTLEEIKKMTRELIEHPKQHIEKGELQDLNKSNPGKGSFPPAGHFEYIIDNVPNYLQEFLGHKCGPTSCTDVMMYWQNQGYLDGSSPGEYADDFAEVIGEEPSPTQIPHGFKEVARLHDETFLTAQNLLLPDTPLPQAYQFFMNFVYFLGERRPIVLCEIELPRGHANCCWGFEGKGEDMKTWKYWVWDTRSYSPRSISAWVQAENRWYKVYYALGWPVEPPEVYYTDPPSGEKGSSEDVDIYKNILIAFTKTMDRTPVESAIEVKNLDENRLVEIKGIEWLEEDKTILLRCYDPEVTDDTTGLQYNRNYQVTIKGTAKDTAGITLDGDKDGKSEGSPLDDYVFTFKTRKPVRRENMDPPDITVKEDLIEVA